MHWKLGFRVLMWSVTSALRWFGDPQQTPDSGAAGITRYNKSYKVFAVCRAAGVYLVKPDWYCGVKFKGPLEFHLSCFSRLVESSRKIKGRKFPALELPLQAIGGTKRLYRAWTAWQLKNSLLLKCLLSIWVICANSLKHPNICVHIDLQHDRDFSFLLPPHQADVIQSDNTVCATVLKTH